MSQYTKLTEKQIYTWFQERRVKLNHTKKLINRNTFFKYTVDETNRDSK